MEQRFSRFGLSPPALAVRFARVLRCFVTALGVGVAGSGVAFANGDRVSLQLNKLEDVDANCRAYLVATNTSAQRLASLNLDLVLFNRDGVIDQRLAVEMAPLRAGKTVVKAFVLANVECGAIGRILLNDVLSCETDDGALADCLDRLDVSSLSTAEFIQ